MINLHVSAFTGYTLSEKKKKKNYLTSFFNVSLACFMVSKFSVKRLFSLFFSFRACSKYAIWLRYFWNTEIIYERTKFTTITDKIVLKETVVYR